MPGFVGHNSLTGLGPTDAFDPSFDNQLLLSSADAGFALRYVLQAGDNTFTPFLYVRAGCAATAVEMVLSDLGAGADPVVLAKATITLTGSSAGWVSGPPVAFSGVAGRAVCVGIGGINGLLNVNTGYAENCGTRTDTSIASAFPAVGSSLVVASNASQLWAMYGDITASGGGGGSSVPGKQHHFKFRRAS